MFPSLDAEQQRRLLAQYKVMGATNQRVNFSPLQ
jgi:hypothetical protein